MTTIDVYDRCPTPTVANALREFENDFHYPLGRDGWFRISHGSDCTRFFRAMGEARCFVAQREGKVAGVISVARPTLRGPGSETIEAAYLADLKIAAPRAVGRYCGYCGNRSPGPDGHRRRPVFQS